MTKRAQKERAIYLRKKGNSYNLIRKELAVSKGILTLWLKDVPYTPNKIVQNRVKGASLKVFQWQQRRKGESIRKAREFAKETLGKLSTRDLLLFGLGLYVGEGSKTSNQIRVVNSNPEVIKSALRWLKGVFGLKTENLTLVIHLYPDNNINESVQFWSKITGIPRKQFGKIQIDSRVKQVKKHGMLRYGTAHLGVRANGNSEHGVFLFRKILALMEESFNQFQ